MSDSDKGYRLKKLFSGDASVPETESTGHRTTGFVQRESESLSLDLAHANGDSQDVEPCQEDAQPQDAFHFPPPDDHGETQSPPSTPEFDGTALSGYEHEYRFQPQQLIDGRYNVIHPLGFGSFAEVYKCRDMQLDQVFAVKVMNFLTTTNEVLREARIMAKLHHPHILRVINIGELEDTGRWYIVMDYKETSRTLENILDAATNLRRLPLDERTLQIVSETASALQYAHNMGIVHQDVKPSNIIVDQEWHAYLTDFGLAVIKRPAGVGASMKTLDAQSGTSGTIPYMSPEQFEDPESDAPPGPSVDIYALGVVAYEMLVGRLPYPGKAAGPIIRQIVEGVRTPPRQFNAEMPEKVEAVLLKQLSKDPRERYASATEFVTALQDAAQAYITAEEMYKEAHALFDRKRWREAQAHFVQLEECAPAYKETRLFLERTQKQVQLLELYEDAQSLLEQGEHEACLEKLSILIQLEPAYPVKALREQAVSALAQQLYVRAAELCQAGRYRECMDTWNKIRERVPDFSDRDGVAGQAQRTLEYQEYLKGLYDASVEYVRRENWDAAKQALEELYREAPDYADVEVRLTMVRYIARLSGQHQVALQSYNAGDYSGCIDQVDRLIQMDREYKPDQVAKLRAQAIEALYTKAEWLLKDQRFEEAIQALTDLKARSDYADSQQIEARAKEGIVVREFHKKLDELYAQAAHHLSRREYQECLDVISAIHREDPDYIDSRELEPRAKESYCNLLYTQALGMLTRRRPEAAWNLWAQILEMDPNYPDLQHIQDQALARMRKRAWLAFFKNWKAKPRAVVAPLESRQRLTRLGRFAGLAAVAGIVVLLLLGGGWRVIRLSNARSMPTAAAYATQSARSLTWEAGSTMTAAAMRAAVEQTETAIVKRQAVIQTAEMALATQTATTKPVATSTSRPMPAETSMPAPTRTATPLPTSSPTLTWTPTPLPQAQTKQASTLFEGPLVQTRQLAIVPAGETLTVLGRSDEQKYGRWLYVRTSAGIEGFIYEPRLSYTLDWVTLTIVEKQVTILPPVPQSTPSPTPSCSGLIITPGTLRIVRIWPAALCARDGWAAYFEVKIAGGDGCAYRLFWDQESVSFTVKEEEPDIAVIQLPGRGGMIVGTIWVESGGERAGLQTSLVGPADCR